uniref:Uncharacterized protein n=1 Tax=Glossina austeni TaxID=7395 RepID=A0A1A9UUF4_GLOAU
MAMAADRIVADKTSNVFESLKHYVNVIILNKNKSYITREITTTIIIKLQAKRTTSKTHIHKTHKHKSKITKTNEHMFVMICGTNQIVYVSVAIPLQAAYEG